MEYYLTIAASDSSGGAGVQQDIKVAHDLGYWTLSAITGITIQDLNNVYTVEPVNPCILKRQIEQCFLSFSVKAIKIGAICSNENLMVIAECLKQFHQRHIVLDPVLFSTSGTSFLDLSSIDLLQKTLFPLTELITPNKPEFELLTNRKISSIDEGIIIAKEKCKEWNTSIFLKGGHFNDTIIREALITEKEVYHFKRKRNAFSYQHGTGCTISTALACFLGKNKSLKSSYYLSTKYLVNLYLRLNNQ